MLHIKSESVSSGNTYDGTFNLTSSINGTYTLTHYYVEDSIDYPWVFTGYNTIVYRVEKDVTDYAYYSATIADFTQRDDMDANAALLQTALRASTVLTSNNWGSHQAYFLQNLTEVTYNSGSNRFEVVWYQDDSSPYVFTVFIAWAHASCTTSTSFGITVNDSGVLLDQVSSPHEYNTEYISLSNIIEETPIFLYVFIDEASSGVSSDDGVRPTLILCLEDIIVGELLKLQGNKIELDISLRRSDMPDATMPWTGKWDLIFT